MALEFLVGRVLIIEQFQNSTAGSTAEFQVSPGFSPRVLSDLPNLKAMCIFPVKEKTVTKMTTQVMAGVNFATITAMAEKFPSSRHNPGCTAMQYAINF